jgi:hypothetical protein
MNAVPSDWMIMTASNWGPDDSSGQLAIGFTPFVGGGACAVRVLDPPYGGR